MGDIRRVLVVGGGVGGLTAAATFARRGVEVVLIERRPAFDIPGVGLGQPANALRVYDALGVLDEILATGFGYDRMCIFDPPRRLIVEHKFLMGDERVPAFCALSRLQLHEILLGAAERAGVEIRLGVTVSEIHDDKDRVDVSFSTGRARTFDLLAGFDGIRSTTRLHLVGTASRRARRVTAPGACRPAARTTCAEWSSAGHRQQDRRDAARRRHHVPVPHPSRSAGRRVRGAGPGAGCSKSAWRSTAAMSPNRRVAQRRSDIVYSPIEPLMLPWPWFRGRVVIGGDAAHTFAPHLTQGAAMAAEDAFVLVREVLADDGPIEARLMRYSRSAIRAAPSSTRSPVNGCTTSSRSARPAGPGSGPGRVGAERLRPHRRQRPHPQRPFLSRGAVMPGRFRPC